MQQDTEIHLRWSNHQTTFLSVFSSLLDNGNLVDCTVGAEGQYFKAHRVILSACSPYFELLFSQHYEKHPIVILQDVKFHVLKALMEFMYSGEVRIPQNKLSTVLKLAETLQIKGLSFAGDSDMKNELRHTRRNRSLIPREQTDLTEHPHEPRVTQVEQMEDGSLPHIVKKESTARITSIPLATQECGKDNSNSIPNAKTVEESAVSRDTSLTKNFNVFQSSSLTQALTKPYARVPETLLLNQVYNRLGTTQMPGSSEGNYSEQRVSNENVLSACSSSVVPKALVPKVRPFKRPVLNMLPEIKQEHPDNFNGHIVEEIILDDDDESDDLGSGDDNSTTFGGLVKVIPEDSFSGQDLYRVDEQYRDSYFVEPASILPNQFTCNSCGRAYRYYRCLWRHLKYVCGKKPQFKCAHCPVQCFHKHHLKAHMIRTHLAY